MKEASSGVGSAFGLGAGSLPDSVAGGSGDRGFTFEDLEGVLLVRFHERDVGNLPIAVDAAGQLPDRPLRLWDLRGLGFDLSTPALRSLAERARSQPHPPRRFAVVVETDLAFGLVRMFGVFREQEGIAQSVFRTLEEALEWLKAE